MPEMPQSEVDALGGFRFLASKYGGTPQGIAGKIEELETDNKKQRDRLKEVEALLPKDGEVVLTKSQAEKLAEYEALGKPSELKTAITTGTQAASELAALRLRESAGKFVKAAGLAEESVDTLVAIPALQGATFTVEKGKVKNDKGVEVDGEIAYITPAGENQQKMPFSEAREKIPALKGLATAAPVTTPPTGTGRPFVGQGTTESGTGSGNGQVKSTLEQVLEKNRAAATAPNPLRAARS